MVNVKVSHIIRHTSQWQHALIAKLIRKSKKRKRKKLYGLATSGKMPVE